MKHVSSLFAVALALTASSAFADPNMSSFNVDLATQTQVSTVTDTLVVFAHAEEYGSDLEAANTRLFAKLNKSLQAFRDSGKYDMTALSTRQTRQYQSDGKYRWVTTGDFTIKTKQSSDIPALNKAMSELSDSYAKASPNFLKISTDMELSQQGRQTVQKQALQESATAFRDKAQAVATAFGFKNYRIVHMNVDNSTPAPRFGGAVPMMAMAKQSEDSVANQVAGNIDVTVNLSGTIELLP